MTPAVAPQHLAALLIKKHSNQISEISQADITVTCGLRDAAKILEIELLDHVVVGDVKSDPQERGYFSFKEAGHL